MVGGREFEGMEHSVLALFQVPVPIEGIASLAAHKMLHKADLQAQGSVFSHQTFQGKSGVYGMLGACSFSARQKFKCGRASCIDYNRLKDEFVSAALLYTLVLFLVKL